MGYDITDLLFEWDFLGVLHHPAIAWHRACCGRAEKSSDEQGVNTYQLCSAPQSPLNTLFQRSHGAPRTKDRQPALTLLRLGKIDRLRRDVGPYRDRRGGDFLLCCCAMCLVVRHPSRTALRFCFVVLCREDRLLLLDFTLRCWCLLLKVNVSPIISIQITIPKTYGFSHEDDVILLIESFFRCIQAVHSTLPSQQRVRRSFCEWEKYKCSITRYSRDRRRKPIDGI